MNLILNFLLKKNPQVSLKYLETDNSKNVKKDELKFSLFF